MSLGQYSYFQAILYIMDAATLVHIIRHIDDSLLLVVLSPFYYEAWWWKKKALSIFSKLSYMY